LTECLDIIYLTNGKTDTKQLGDQNMKNTTQHIHQDLMNMYQDDQAWQVNVGHTGFVNNVNGDGKWISPIWYDLYTYRLHPYNDLIQAFNKGAKIEYYDNGKWKKATNPKWDVSVQYCIKPKAQK
jgi:hypothetical protein